MKTKQFIWLWWKNFLQIFSESDVVLVGMGTFVAGFLTGAVVRFFGFTITPIENLLIGGGVGAFAMLASFSLVALRRTIGPHLVVRVSYRTVRREDDEEN